MYFHSVWYSDPVEEDGAPGGNDNLAKYHYKGLMDLARDAGELPPDILNLDKDTTQYYMCGPKEFMKVQRKGLVSLGVDESRIHWESF